MPSAAAGGGDTLANATGPSITRGPAAPPASIAVRATVDKGASSGGAGAPDGADADDDTHISCLSLSTFCKPRRGRPEQSTGRPSWGKMISRFFAADGKTKGDRARELQACEAAAVSATELDHEARIH